MSSAPQFPDDLLLNEKGRSARLIGEFYEQYSQGERSYTEWGRQHEEVKAAFYRKHLQALGHDETSLGVDIGVLGGIITRMVDVIHWVGVDINAAALEFARASGIACHEMDFGAAIDFRDDSFDAVLMTEVMEHLAYPSITVREVHRILKKKPASFFAGSVPLDYHLHRRWKVMRGKRLSGEQTHIHHFSFAELDRLLRFHFERVEYLPLSGTAARHPRWKLPYNLFVRDIAWAASSPRLHLAQWDLGIM